MVLVQIAVQDHVYLLDVPHLSNILSTEEWIGWAFVLFGNDQTLTIGKILTQAHSFPDVLIKEKK